jgi:hypothetical protein
MSIYQVLKNVRRRSVETILQTVGASEHTVDEEFDTLSVKFDVMIQDMNECKYYLCCLLLGADVIVLGTAAVHKTLLTQKVLFGESRDFATIFARVYQANKEDQEWPPSARKIEFYNQAAELKRVFDFIQDVIRSSTTMVCAEESIAPMKQTMMEVAPSVEHEKKERDTMIKDYDSYRRRLKGLEQKRDAAEVLTPILICGKFCYPLTLQQAGKGGSDKAAETLNEISKFENKVTNAEAAYTAQNQKTKVQILAAKELHDEMMDSMLINVLVTQVRKLWFY